jgi:hypothetical protein
MRRFLIAVIIALTPISLLAADDAFTRLKNARSLRCVLGAGAYADWDTGKPVVKQNKFYSR